MLGGQTHLLVDLCRCSVINGWENWPWEKNLKCLHIFSHVSIIYILHSIPRTILLLSNITITIIINICLIWQATVVWPIPRPANDFMHTGSAFAILTDPSEFFYYYLMSRTRGAFCVTCVLTEFLKSSAIIIVVVKHFVDETIST